jgi:adenine-specific DNA methylase
MDQCRKEIGQFYKLDTSEGLIGARQITHHEGWIPVGYLWGRTIPCQNPNCGGEIPLIKQFWLSKKSNKKIAYRPVVNIDRKHVKFEILEGTDLNKAMSEGFNPSIGTVERANALCLICGQVTKAKDIRRLGKTGKMNERLVIVVLHHPNEIGKKYRLARESDFELYENAEHYFNKHLKKTSDLESPVPLETIPEMSGAFNIPLYGINSWDKLFNSRQKLAITTTIRKLHDLNEEIREDSRRVLDAATYDKKKFDLDHDALQKAIKGYIALAIDMMAAFTNNCARWENTSEAIKHLYSRQALPMMWDYIEANPFSGSSGTFASGLPFYLKFILFGSATAHKPCIVTMQSASDLTFNDNEFAAIFTDPPYYDSVPYAELADFFYLWLKRSVGEEFKELFSTPLTPKSNEIVQMATWDPARYSFKDKIFFEKELGSVFREFHRVLEPGGIAVIVYAHKSTEGWESMLEALNSSGLQVTASWPIHTEMKSRLRAAQSAALASSIYMVCRKTVRDKIGFWNDIQPEVKQRVEEKLEHFWEAGIAGGDFFISAIGPGMEAFSRFEKIEAYDGSDVKISELLKYIRSVSSEYLINKLLKDASTESIDKEAQFYLTYRWTYLDNSVDYDDARKIASAEGIDLKTLWTEGGFVKKQGSKISILGPDQRKDIKNIGNMVDAMHHSCNLWKKGDRNIVEEFLASSAYGSSGAYWQFCQAVAECLQSGSKEKQLLEGLLLGKDQYQKAASEEKPEQLDLDM